MLRAEFLDIEIGDRLVVVAHDSLDHNKKMVVTEITPHGRLDVDKGLPFKIPVSGRLVHVKIYGEDRVGVLEPDDCEFLSFVDLDPMTRLRTLINKLSHLVIITRWVFYLISVSTSIISSCSFSLEHFRHFTSS